MDTRNEVRQFLTALRARVTPEKAGLTVFGGERRVPGLRREEVAQLAGVSTAYYTRMERGFLGTRSGDFQTTMWPGLHDGSTDAPRADHRVLPGASAGIEALHMVQPGRILFEWRRWRRGWSR